MAANREPGQPAGEDSGHRIDKGMTNERREVIRVARGLPRLRGLGILAADAGSAVAAASPPTHTECTKPVYSSVVGERSIRSKKTARNAPSSDILELRKAAAPSFGRAGATARRAEPQEGSVMSVVLFDRATPPAVMLRRRWAWRLEDESFRVIGRGGNDYRVIVIEGQPVCECRAADFGHDLLAPRTGGRAPAAGGAVMKAEGSLPELAAESTSWL